MTRLDETVRVLTRKDDPKVVSLVRGRESLALREGEVAFRLKTFGLSANNLTYADFGDAMGYWRFFPSPMEGWGCMPVWGVAEAVETATEKVKIGERVFGYFPIADRFVMAPRRANADRFYDLARHRQILSGIYNEYERLDDHANLAIPQNELCVFRPLYLTAHMLSWFLQSQSCFGAHRAIISSASSKTALATGFSLAGAGLERVGLTSRRNLQFAIESKCYDSVLAYDELDRLSADTPSIYIDYSGDPACRSAIREKLGSRLAYDCFAGSTRSSSPPGGATSDGDIPKLFFAPDQLRQRGLVGGRAPLDHEVREGLTEFLRHVCGGWPPLISICVSAGLESVGDLIRKLRNGEGKPAEGHVVAV
jgi:hypothetical protein